MIYCLKQIPNISRMIYSSIEEEVEKLDFFLKTEQHRLSYVFDYSIEIINEDILIDSIPSMLAVSLVEDRIMSGFSIYARDEKGFISIRISEHKKNAILIIIEDNGVNAYTENEHRRKKNSSYTFNIENLVQTLNMTKKHKVKLNRKSNYPINILELIIRQRYHHK